MALIKYSCEVCHRLWDTEEQADACEATHKGATEILECRYKKKAQPELYPSSLLMKMADGKQIVYYMGRAEKQPTTPLKYESVPYPTDPTGGQ